MSDATSQPTRRSARTRVAAAVLVTLCVAACAPWSDAEYETVTFRNDTLETVSVVYRSPAGAEGTIAHSIGPGQIASDDAVAGGGCTIGQLIARTETGVEIARRSEPLCLGQTWSIVASQ